MNFRFLSRLLFIVLLFVMLIAPFTWLNNESDEVKPIKATHVEVKPIKETHVEVKPIKETIVEVKPKQAVKAKTPVVPKEITIPTPPEKALHTLELPDFSKIRDVKEKKRQFFAFLKPAIESENEKLLALRAKLILIVEKISLEEPLLVQEHELLAFNAKKYKVSDKFSELHQANELIQKVDIIPTELVLVQAANESAWGTSRFARIGLNYFGLWCYRKGCGLVPSGRNEGAKHEVAAFRSVNHAVERYLFNINTNNAYTTFRQIRAQLRAHQQPLTPEILVTGLLAYSQRGGDYILELTDMLKHNRSYF